MFKSAVCKELIGPSSIRFCSSHFKLILRKIKPTSYPLQHASSFVQLLVVVAKSSDKILNDLMFDQTLNEVNVETLKIRNLS